MSIEKLQALEYPRLIYFIGPNKNYGVKFTLEDIEKPSEECYGHVWGDAATLGRQLPPYEEWAQRAMQYDLEDKIKSTECKLSVEQIAVSSAQDLVETLSLFVFDKEIRFIDPIIEEHFRSL